MRVLMCGGLNTAQTLRSALRGFEMIGCEVMHFPTRGHTPRYQPAPAIHDLLLRVVVTFKPDLLYWYMCKTDCPPGLITYLRKRAPQMRAVFHSFDDPYQIDCPEGPPPCIPEFDAAVTCARSALRYYEALGVRAIVAYPPPDETLHRRIGAAPPQSDAEYIADFTFVATNTYPRALYPHVLAERADIARAAASLGSLRLYGHWDERHLGWGGRYGAPELKRCYCGWLGYDEQPEVYVRTRVNLGSHVRPDADGYLNERVLSVLGAGGFLLTDHVAGIETSFEPGVHLDTWRTLDEFTEKAARWLRDDARRRAVARAGYERVWDRFGNRQHALAVVAVAGLASRLEG